MTHNVRGHTRRTGTGRTTTVREHRRRGGPRPNAVHAWQVGKRGWSARRRKRHGIAAALFTFAVAEFGLWAAFNIIGVICGFLGAILIGLATVLVSKKDGSR